MKTQQIATVNVQDLIFVAGSELSVPHSFITLCEQSFYLFARLVMMAKKMDHADPELEGGAEPVYH